MSLYIKGVDMPKDKILTIQIHPDGRVYTGHPLFLNFLEAQAIQIPTPHGRLIDGDELINDLRIYESKYCGEQGYITQDDIIDAPTIIDAEE